MSMTGQSGLHAPVRSAVGGGGSGVRMILLNGTTSKKENCLKKDSLGEGFPHNTKPEEKARRGALRLWAVLGFAAFHHGHSGAA